VYQVDLVTWQRQYNVTVTMSHVIIECKNYWFSLRICYYVSMGSKFVFKLKQFYVYSK